jgi:hypothetical protein
VGFFLQRDFSYFFDAGLLETRFTCFPQVRDHMILSQYYRCEE